MFPSLQKFLKFSQNDKILIIKATTLLTLIRLGLKLLDLRNLRSLLNKISQSSPKKDNKQISIYKIIWSITTASSYMPNVKCLARGLAAQVLLEQQGYPTKLRIGIAKDKEKTFVAHAWVECKGRVVIGGIGNSINKYRVMPIKEFEKLGSSSN